MRCKLQTIRAIQLQLQHLRGGIMRPLLLVTLFAMAQVISYLIAFATNLITNTCQRAEPCAPKPPSGPTCDSVWAQWGEWGGCNAECGGGQRGRMRNVETRSQCNGMACEGVVEQEGGFLTVGPSIHTGALSEARTTLPESSSRP